MDTGRIASTLADWIDVESITGNEADYADALSRALARHGFDVELQEMAPGRPNVLARAEAPEEHRRPFWLFLDAVGWF